MLTRRQWHLSALSALVSASLLAACGGGDSEPTTSRVVVFGDSLSDMGAYTPATQIPLGQAPGVAPFLGGKFTTNTHTGYTATNNNSTANTWGEWVAARLGIAITQHEVGFGTQSVKCPAAANPALAASCTGYAQGGSRVTDPNGIGKSSGFLTRPLVTQVADHLTRFSSFNSGDIVFVYGGNNDVFVQSGAAAQGLPPATAIANVQQAATELATLVKSQILANGATRVAVMNLPDSSETPGNRNLPAPNKAFLTQLSAEFNAALTTGLAGAAVRIIDSRALVGDAVLNPSKYGFTNTTDAACDPAKMSPATGGSSLFCNAAAASAFTAAGLPNLNSLKTGATANTYMFADGVHPTTGGHKAFADQVITKLKDFGWIPINQ